MLEKEFQYYIRNQNRLVKKYRGKFIVIKNQKVIGIYDTDIEAYKKAQEDHKLGTFLIQPCMAGNESYTQTFHSRVAI